MFTSQHGFEHTTFGFKFLVATTKPTRALYIYIYRFQRHSLHVGGTAQSAKRLITNGRYVKLCQHGFCTKKANFNLHWKFEVCTSTQLHIRPSSPSYSIIGDLQWFRIVPAKPLRSNVVSLWSYLIPLSGSLPGHHFRPWGCWGAR